MTQQIINDNLPYTQAVAIGGQTIFATNPAWTANQASDVVVYYTPNGQSPNDLTQLLATNLYTVQFIGGNNTVQITLVNPASSGDLITIVRNTPADFLNLYTNTNFTPSMLNNDFGILTLVDQQAQVFNQQVAPRYNFSALINQAGPGADTYLPILGPNQFWVKNNAGTAIEALDASEILGGVTLINTGLGLTGGPIDSTGTISFAAMPAHTFWGNVTGSTALPTQVSTSYFLAAQNNLSDLTNVVTARTNLGVAIGVNVEAWSAALDSIAGLTTSANQMLITTASNTYAVISGIANATLITNAGSVPSFSQTLPTAVQSNITELGAQTQQLDMNSHKIVNLTDPTNPQDAATRAYVLAQTTGSFLPLSGGTMSGAINMGNQQINQMADPSSSQDAVTLSYLNTQLGFKLSLSGGTMSGQINMGSNKIISLLDPTNPQDAATKNYVDTVAIGLKIQPAVYAATTANLAGYTYSNGSSGIGATLTAGSNGAFSTDGTSPPTNARILVWVQTTSFQNGIYDLTQQGDLTHPAILTRSTDYDQPSEIQPGDFVIVQNGTLYQTTSFIQTDSVSAIGTDAIQFTQFTFAPTSFLLKANNLSDVANTTTSFNNISPLTTKGDLIGFSTLNIRVGVGSNSTLLMADSTATAGFKWTTATYPNTTIANQILYSSSTNTIAGLATLAGGILVTDASSVPQFLTNPSAAGKVLQSANSAIPAWSTPTYPSASGTSGTFLISDGTNNIYSTSTIPTSAGATSGKILVSDGTNYVLSTPTFPNASATANKIIKSDGTNWIASTETYAAPGTSGNILTSDGTNWVSSPNAGVTLLTTKGDLFSFSTVPARLPVATGNGKILQVDSTASVGLSYSTPTYPSASGTARKLLVSDGTNIVYTTETWATPGTSGNVMTSDGTNWTSSSTTASGRLIGIQVFTATGSNTYTPSAGVNHAFVELWGAGGGGGASNSASTGGGGGGGGSYAASYVSVSGSVTISIGTGGNGQAAGNGTAGTNGGDTTYNTTTVVAKGGSFGSGGTPGAGGIAGTGTITMVGSIGNNSSPISNISGQCAGGGSSPKNIPAPASVVVTHAGLANSGQGGGAGDSAAAGGAGGSGYAVVWEYS